MALRLFGGGRSDNSVYYFYGQLSSSERVVYDELLRGLMAMQSSIPFSSGVSFDMISRMVELVLNDHPEIFWFSGAGNMSQRGGSFSFQPKYTISRETKQEREARIRRVVSEFLESTRRCRTDVECLEAAFNYLVKNVSYVDGCIDNQNICSALLNHKSVCAGYSKSLQYLMQKMGKECLFISGITAKKGRHAWNIVKLGGKYYHTDVTFGDRSFSDGTMVGSGLPAELEAEYAYLCMSDEEALRERRITMKAGIRLPACTSNQMSWYRRNHLCFTSAEEAWRQIEQSLSRGQKYWCCQFESDSAYSRFVMDVSNSRFSSMALEKLRLRQVRTNTSKNDSMRCIVGWVR